MMLDGMLQMNCPQLPEVEIGRHHRLHLRLGAIEGALGPGGTRAVEGDVWVPDEEHGGLLVVIVLMRHRQAGPG